MTAIARGPSKKGAGSSAHTGESIRETIESIVVAFILAFVFRAFVVEAFVIPTGSMAPTLLGEHAVHTCTDCGWEYAYGRARDERGRLFQVPGRSTCPNCGFSDETVPREYDPPNAGDRILVLKWPFDIGGKWLGPKRWEVTVFKDPADGKTNFIKRLVGCPSEALELIDGDVYTVPAAKLPPDLRDRMDRIRHLNYRRMEIQQRADALGYDDAQTVNERMAVNRELAALQREVVPALDSCLRIQRKLPSATLAQESLWFVVFDLDYLPTRGQDVGWQAYPPGSSTAWNTSGRTIRFDGLQRPLEAIRLVGRSACDCYAYNFDSERPRGRPADIVADRRLRCLFTPLQGDGRFRLRMTKYTDDFVAELNPSAGTATLTMTSQPGKSKPRTTVIGSKSNLSLPFGKPVEVELINVDYRVSFALNGEELFATSDEMYHPDITALRNRRATAASASGEGVNEPIAELAAEHLDLELRHLVLERDVYYTNPSLCSDVVSHLAPNRTNPFCPEGDRQGRGVGLASPGWGTEGNPILLRDKEYFMLGDNSPQSKDSRLWWEVSPLLTERGENYQLGTVPEDQLIGHAFFVYWPSGFRPSWAIRIALVPNVGRMRWIR
jgi:signal peptidase I